MSNPFRTSRTPSWFCPYCGYLADSATDATGTHAVPKPDDLSICINCAGVLMFDYDLNIVAADEKLLDELSPHIRRAIDEGRRHIRRRGPIDRGSKH